MSRTEPAAQHDQDADALAQFGYRQELSRSLSVLSLWAVSFATISITTGIFLNYGFGLANFGPAAIWTWPIAVVGQGLVALVVAELGARIPLAGYAYQWGRRLVGTGYGWFLGWTGLMYMLVGGAGVTLLVTAPLVATVAGWDTSNGRLMVFITIVLMALALLINVISVQITARVNNVAVVVEILGTVGGSILLFFLWVTKAKPTGHGFGILGDHAGHGFSGFALAGLLGIFTIVGFEFAADLSEEAVNPRRNVPRAVIQSVLVAGVLGMVALIGFTLAIPDLAKISASGEPLVDIISFWLGGTLAKIFIAMVAFAIFALITVGMTAQARLVYSMARDNVLPASGVLRKVNPRTQTPVVALVVSAVLGIGFVLYGYNQASAFGTLVAAASTFPYLLYGLVLIAYAARGHRLPAAGADTFTLGRFRTPVIVLAGVWLVAALLVLVLPKEFRQADYVVVAAEVVAALWYFFGLRPRIARGTVGSGVAGEVAADPRPTA